MHQGVIAVCDCPAETGPIPESASLLVALDGVQDPGNVGTVIRTMDAAGYHCLLMDEKTADPYGPKALRASMGGVFRIPVRRCAAGHDEQVRLPHADRRVHQPFPAGLFDGVFQIGQGLPAAPRRDVYAVHASSPRGQYAPAGG